MKSVRNIYKIGIGPSSSHTMGPVFAAKIFKEKYSSADKIEVILYGSLAKTGKGHGTDRAITETLAPIKNSIIFYLITPTHEHPNTMDFIAFRGTEKIGEMRVLSIGGGEIKIVGEETKAEEEIYNEKGFTEIADYCKANNIRLSDYVFCHEDENFKSFLLEVWHTMCNTIREGLTHTGTLPGGLKVERKAQYLFNQRHIDESPQTRENRLVAPMPLL